MPDRNNNKILRALIYAVVCALFFTGCESFTNFMLAPSIFGGKYYGAFIDSDSDTDSASESSSAESTPEPPKDRRIFRNVTGLDIRITIYGGTDVSESDFVIAPFSSKTITYRGHFNYSVRELIPETFWSSFDGGDIITIDFHPTYKAKHGIK